MRAVESASPSPAAVHVGRREHYRLARDMVAKSPERAVLIQRSSTLLLGPEAGWHHEAEFYSEVWRSVSSGTRWFHIASLGGIERHLQRTGSSFPLVMSATSSASSSIASRVPSSHLATDRGIVTIRSGPRAAPVDQPVKVLPDERTGELGDDFRIDDFKFDRQIRLVAADFGTHREALVVSDVGDQQVTIRLDGHAADVLVDVCIQFYERCPSLTIDELTRCLAGARQEAPV